MYGKTIEIHRIYRDYRSKGFTRGESLKLVEQHHNSAWCEMIDFQNQGIPLDALEKKDEKRMAQIRSTGKLL